MAGKGLERRSLQRLCECVCVCVSLCAQLNKISLKPLGSKKAGSVIEREG